MNSKNIFSIKLFKDFYFPGESIEGCIKCDVGAEKLHVDTVHVTLFGEITKTNSEKQLIINKNVEIWKNCTLDELLGFDENQNEACSSSNNLANLPFHVNIPRFCPPTFYCRQSPITIQYWLTMNFVYKNQVVSKCDSMVSILPINEPNSPKTQQLSFTKNINLNKGRFIFAEILLNTDTFYMTDVINGIVNVKNMWKQSIKYIHLNIVRKISTLTNDNQCVDTVTIETTGVVITNEKQKLSSGECFSFHPKFQIPALPPTIHIDGLFTTNYLLKLTLGRSRQFILGSMEVPIKIITQSDKSRAKIEGK